jgi:formylglycine-generating enzyme required for sulfatase activity/predicted Ser/Thr protein kinase
MATPRLSMPISPPPGIFPKPPSYDDAMATLDRDLQTALGQQYVVEERLGSGGFAVVFLVLDQSLGRRLAVKVLAPDMALSRSGLERFHREAASIARLSHPNIVPLHFAGQQGDLVYLAMQYVEGETLADRVAREGRLPIHDVVRILREVASALDLAHRRGIVHRDIKPANILLERESGRALVTDFGVARVADQSGLTTAGLVVGTPAYFSPEQVGGVTSDQRSDLYSLGLVAYEMLAGALPFGGHTTNEILLQRLADTPPSIRKIRPDVPAALDAAVLRCLEPEPEHRFQTGADLVKVLEEELPTTSGRRPSVAALAARSSRRPRWLLPVGGALGVVAAAAGVWLATRGPSLPQPPVVPDGMVIISAGTYRIGSDTDSLARARPEHAVPLPAFALDRTEVTVGAYARFAQETNAERPWGGDAPPDPLLPVTGVRWSEASAFCASRGARLPTEFEWEAAARGPQGRRYTWGDTVDPTAAALAPGVTGPSRVGTHPHGNSPEGVADLIGNVWEWTSSRFESYPGGTPIAGTSVRYVIRGGAFTTPVVVATGYYRSGITPSPASRGDIALTGFRCAASLPAAGAAR